MDTLRTEPLMRVRALHRKNGNYVYKSALMPGSAKYAASRWDDKDLRRFCAVRLVTSLKDEASDPVVSIGLNKVGYVLACALNRLDMTVHTQIPQIHTVPAPVLSAFIDALLKTPARELPEDCTAPTPALGDLAAFHGLRSGLHFEDTSEADKKLLDVVARLALSMLGNLYDWPYFFQIVTDDAIRLLVRVTTTEVALMMRAVLAFAAERKIGNAEQLLHAWRGHAYIQTKRDPAEILRLGTQVVNNAWVARWCDAQRETMRWCRWINYAPTGGESDGAGAAPDCMGDIVLPYEALILDLLDQEIREAAQQIRAGATQDTEDQT